MDAQVPWIMGNLRPKVKLELVGLNGNAFNLLAHFSRAARAQGWSEEHIAEVVAEATESDYDHLLQVLVANTTPWDDGNSGRTSLE